MEGIRKLPLPKITRQMTEAATPTMAAAWSLVLSHCSTNTVTNRAVRAKSMPSVLKLMTAPRREPSTLPSTQ